jgi:hypothetical protein
MLIVQIFIFAHNTGAETERVFAMSPSERVLEGGSILTKPEGLAVASQGESGTPGGVNGNGRDVVVNCRDVGADL